MTGGVGGGRGFRKLEVADPIDPEGGVNVAVFFFLFSLLTLRGGLMMLYSSSCFSLLVFSPEGMRGSIARLGPIPVLTVLLV